MKQQAQETKQSNEKLEAEERELLKIIAKADVERIRQKKELDQVQSTDRWKVLSACPCVPPSTECLS